MFAQQLKKIAATFMILFVAAFFQFAHADVIGKVATIERVSTSQNYRLTGWACATGNASSIKVHLYAGKKAGDGGTNVGTSATETYTANIESEQAIDDKCGASGNYRFSILLKESTVDKYAGQKIYVYGIAPSGVSGGNKLLANSGSPKFPSRFKLFWHLGPIIEEIADATATSTSINSDIEKMQEMTSGYYFLVMSNGYYRYWNGRPDECFLSTSNLQWGQNVVDTLGQTLTLTGTPTAVKESCDSLYTAYARSQVPNSIYISDENKKNYLQSEAIRKVIDKLALRSGSGPGYRGEKKLLQEMILTTTAFTYTATSPTRTVDSLMFKDNIPEFKFKVLVDNGAYQDMINAYHEPYYQYDQGNEMTMIPSLARTASGACVKEGCDLAGLDNDVLRLINGAFQTYQSASSASFTIPKLITDIRAWTSFYEQERFESNGSYSNLSHVLFEGGPLAMTKSSFATFATGLAYLLNSQEHKSKDIYFVMPNSKSPEDMLGAYVNGYPPMVNDYRQYLKELNRLLKQVESAQSICNPRIRFLPAGYGSKVQAKTFPMQTTATTGSQAWTSPATSTPIWANTTAGLVGALDELRTELCGP